MVISTSLSMPPASRTILAACSMVEYLPRRSLAGSMPRRSADPVRQPQQAIKAAPLERSGRRTIQEPRQAIGAKQDHAGKVGHKRLTPGL